MAQEYLDLKQAISDNNAKNKKLRERLNQVEDDIRQYMVVNNHPGIRYKNKAILLHDKKRC